MPEIRRNLPAKPLVLATLDAILASDGMVYIRDHDHPSHMIGASNFKALSSVAPDFILNILDPLGKKR